MQAGLVPKEREECKEKSVFSETVVVSLKSQLITRDSNELFNE